MMLTTKQRGAIVLLIDDLRKWVVGLQQRDGTPPYSEARAETLDEIRMHELRISALSDLLTQHDALEGELSRIDNVLARRPALADCKSRVEAIKHCISVAKRCDDAEAECAELRAKCAPLDRGCWFISSDDENTILSRVADYVEVLSDYGNESPEVPEHVAEINAKWSAISVAIRCGEQTTRAATVPNG